MKKHAIIPIFIPHIGCPYACVFCNQNEITARDSAPSAEDVRKTMDTWLSTLRPKDGPGVETVEAAFYGGSFTGIPMEMQNVYLDIADEYKTKGLIDKIHMSTRPDYIDDEILTNLKKHQVDTIELGVQSFDDEVLKKSNRGHDSACVYRACQLIKDYDFELGIQLMIGLPGDSLETCIYSAKEAARLQPSLARLYPTIVLDNTKLKDMYDSGEYHSLNRDEAVERTKEMYKILDDAGITIMRVGLKSTDIIRDGGAVNGGTYHPAFRQLVEGAIARERIEDQLKDLLEKTGRSAEDSGRNDTRIKVDIFSSPSWFSNMIGNSGVNRDYFSTEYPDLNIRYHTDGSLRGGEFRVTAK